jgi:hypothetical protein
MGRMTATTAALFVVISAAYGQVGWRVNVAEPDLWRPMPGWLGNPSQNALVQSTREGLRFVVPEAGRGMKWLCAARWVNTQRFRYLVVRYRARGILPNPDDYFLYLNDSSDLPETSRYVLCLSDLRVDGEWHWATVDLLQRQVRPYLKHIALQVQAAEANAEIVIADISFRDTPPEGTPAKQETTQPYREQVLPLSDLGRLRAQPDWLGNPSAQASMVSRSDGVHLRVPEAGRGMKWSLALQPSLQLHETPYVIVEYRARGVANTGDYFLYMAPDQPSLPQERYTPLRLNEVVSLDKWRTLVARVPEATKEGLSTLAIQVQASEPNAEVVIRSIRFASQPREQLLSLEDELPEPRSADAGKFLPVDVSAGYNFSLKQVASGLPLSSYRFRNGQVVAAGVPFRVATDERNVASVGGETGVISVPLPSSLQRQMPGEVYFLLVADFPRWEEPAYGGGTLYRVQHPHRFVVQLLYADGTMVEVFPLRVATGRHEVIAGIDVYAVPVNRALREIRLCDRMRLGEFGLCAITLNMGKRRFDPNLWTAAVPVSGRRGTWNPPSRPEVNSTNGALILQNANVRLRIDIARGIRLKEISLLSIRRNILTQSVPLFAVRAWDGANSITSLDYRVANASAPSGTVQLDCVPTGKDLPAVRLQMRLVNANRLRIVATVQNREDTSHRWIVSLPHGWTFHIGDGDVYTYPLRTLLISNRDGDWRFRYSGTMPLQMLDVSNHQLGAGIGVLMTDLNCIDRYLHVTRRGTVTTVSTEWRCDPLQPGESKELQIELLAHPGDWRETFAHYRSWTGTWYRPLAPRKQWFRKAFAFRQDYIADGLYDRDSQTYRFEERIALARKAFGACDYLHIFDWGTTPLGRVGDYDPWGDPLSSADAFRQAVWTTQARGVPVGLYIEGYLADERSKVAQAHLQEWGWRGRDGEVLRWAPQSTEFFMCPGAEGWRQYLTQTYRRVSEQTGAMGFYIDEFGFGDRDCFAQGHEHPVGWHLLPAEGKMTRSIREVLPPETVLYTENFPPDIHTILQDGSFDYAINYYQSVARNWTPLPLRLSRFAFPDFKVFQIVVCDHPTGSNEEAVQQVFFNGDGYWLQGDPDTWFTPETLATLRRCIRILREHADAFAGDRCEPLVPTLRDGVFANRFTSADGRKNVWTLYNASWRSVKGKVIAVPHVPGARYLDAWNGKPLQPAISGGKAILQLSLPPHGVGCVVQVR